MRVLQFWILIIGSTFVSGLMIKQIFLSRDLDQEQRVFVDSQETASTGPSWEKAWEKVAIHIYLASRQDPTLAQVLKDEGVQVRQGTPGGNGSASGAPSAQPAPSKTPVAPLQPSAPE